MVNSTLVSYFSLSAYVDSGPFRFLFFAVILCLYALIVGANALLIVVICTSRSLHRPMYLLLCSLFANELQGSAGFFPFFLIQILSDVHTVSASCCFVQIFFLFSYINVQLCSLTVMSYDRFLAICHPLQYGRRMTVSTVAKLIALAWTYPFTEVAVMMCLSARLPLCGNVIDKLYCDNYSVAKLSCSDSSGSNIRGMVYIVCVVAGVVSVILYSYVRILQVCFSGSRQTRQKAVATCSPHLASLLNFSFGCVFELVQSRFDMSTVPNLLRVFLSLYFLTCQPLFNPVLYGLKMSKIRGACKRLLSSR